mgnify:CR=1 FL=1
MQKTINIILKAVIAAFLAVLATGCITDKFDTSNGLQSVMLQVNISAGEMTKAEPSPAESAINSVRIYAYRTDGTQAGHFYRAAVSDEPIIMDLTLPETGTHYVKFYVFVNEASMLFMDNFTFKEEMTQAQLSAARFHNVNPSYGFPMYCEQTEVINVDNVSQTANNTEGHEGHFYLVQQVSFGLIRPMAKMSVYAAIAEGGAPGSISINQIGYQINGTRNYNYLLPQTPEVLAAVPVRTDGRDMISQSVGIMRTLDKTDAAAVRDPANYDLIIADQYLGEVEVGDNDWSTKESDRQAVLHVQYTVGTDGQILNGYVYLPEIVRNHHYKVCMLINTEGNIIINYYVADWDDADMTELWFDYPSHSYLRVAPNDTDLPADPASMSVSQPFTGYFKLSYPAEETWTPVLLSHATECEVRVFKVGEETSPLTYPIPADSENWYKITVSPSASLAAGAEVEFAITYSPLGSMDKYEYLMINGSQNSPYWPYSGTSDPNKVIIKVN